MNQVYHVTVTGNDQWAGSLEHPFRTISKAAALAEVGDHVIVHEGVYREWVKPEHKGYSNTKRVVYEAAKGEKVVIKGSEVVKDWEHVEGTVWKASIDNSMFGDYNPYAEELEGDWLVYPVNYKLHAGDVYLNGKSLYEASGFEELKNPVMRMNGYAAPWTKHPEPLLHPEDSIYQWKAEVGDEQTVIYANFQEKDPNKEFVEINVRKCCFYPERTGVDYITVRGFEIAHAACPWAPPTADQPGMVGPHWAKGWIIEDNILHDAKCSAISLGKEYSTGHNLCTRRHRKPGYQYQMEAVFRAKQIGWDKEKIGSHVVRNNTIYDCGQNGIVGHLGCIFSTIENNHIYNIAKKHEYFGYEIAGIKLHAAIDVQIIHNRIHNCSLGTWLDWQAQGTRVSRNLYYDNDRDFFIEVTHGPCMVDNNIFASEYSFDNVAEGTAYIHNLCCGTMRKEACLDRATPYHFPHSTDVAGVSLVYSGDDRIYQNIYLGGQTTYTEQSQSGTHDYDGCMTSIEEYMQTITSKGNGDHEQFASVTQPAYINKNAYLKGAKPFERERYNFVSDEDPMVKVAEDADGVYLQISVEKGMFEIPTTILKTEDIEMVRITEAAFENPDGSPMILNQDFLGNERAETPTVGPIEGLKEGENKIYLFK